MLLTAIFAADALSLSIFQKYVMWYLKGVTKGLVSVEITVGRTNRANRWKKRNGLVCCIIAVVIESRCHTYRVDCSRDHQLSIAFEQIEEACKDERRAGQARRNSDVKCDSVIPKATIHAAVVMRGWIGFVAKRIWPDGFRRVLPYRHVKLEPSPASFAPSIIQVALHEHCELISCALAESPIIDIPEHSSIVSCCLCKSPTQLCPNCARCESVPLQPILTVVKRDSTMICSYSHRGLGLLA
ncbi:hypothetical protein KCU90_g242, partial [Aureobasidium melanogenum]